ncbi:MAG: twin-arginine translocation signal domain-containing protein [Deltaproteobacteria bacterium]|nr:twin-arginine translocation signal domain-containing protein [Deltaproteobacteria bacterium]
MSVLEDLERLLTEGKITRREFLARASALGLAAAASPALLPARAKAATPRKGGTVRMSAELHGPDDQMDPIVFTSTIDYARGRATYNGLIQILDNMSLHPELAEEWSTNSNATEYTFKIRKGVHFHDGSQLTADDVVWSMRRHLGKDSPSVIKAVNGRRSTAIP